MEFSSQTDYLKRSICDDFLQQLPPSMNELTKGREIIPKNPRLIAGEGFYDRANCIGDA